MSVILMENNLSSIKVNSLIYPKVCYCSRTNNIKMWIVCKIDPKKAVVWSESKLKNKYSTVQRCWLSQFGNNWEYFLQKLLQVHGASVKSQCLKQWYKLNMLICFLAPPPLPFILFLFTLLFFLSFLISIAYREQSSNWYSY